MSLPRGASLASMSAWRTVLVVMVVSGVAQSFGRFTYAVLLPAIQEDLAISYTLAGTVGSANLLAYLGGSMAASYLSTKWAPTTIIKSGLTLSVLGLATASVASDLALLLTAMVVTGFAGATIWIPAPGVAGAAVAPHRRGLAVGLTGSGIGLGMVAASVLAAQFRQTQGDAGWRSVYLVETVIGAIALIAALLWLRSQRSESTSGVQLSSVRLVPGWPYLLGGYITYGIAYALFTIFIVASLEEDLGFSATEASQMFLVMGIAVVPGGIGFGALSDQLGRRPAMALAYFAMAAGALLVRQPALVIVGVIVFGISFSGIPAVIAASVSDAVTPRQFGAAFGAITVFFGISQIIAPQLGGWLFDTTGSFAWVYGVSAVAATLGGLFTLRLPKRLP